MSLSIGMIQNTPVQAVQAGPVEQLPSSQRRKRIPVNCEECRRSKLRCDRRQPCGACKRRRRDASCSYDVSTGLTTSTNTHRIAGSIQVSSAFGNRVGCSTTSSRETLATASRPRLQTPDTDQLAPDTHWDTVLERPAPESDAHDTSSPLSIGLRLSLQEIIESLPPKPCCDYLISHFFKNISTLFPILHGPTFQKQYTRFMQRTPDIDIPWLALLFSLCSLALNTMDDNDPRLAPFWSQLPSSPAQVPATVYVSRCLLRTAMTCLLQDNFFVNHTFSTFEALLMVIYNLSHNESVEQGWALLGMALNIGIALRCNVDQNSSHIETERRRRCWAGLLTLHTYQGMLFRDVDMSYLLNIKSSLPANVNDSGITEEGNLYPSSHGQPTQMSVMLDKVRLFRLSTEICRHISGPSRLDQLSLHKFDDAIADEQKQWDLTYMVDGSPSILDSASYAYWCVLQTYAHHLYLLLHRPFHHSKAPCFLATSRERCINSSKALISIHRELYEAPILRNYLWLLRGVTSLKALHAAVALNSCLQDVSSETDLTYDLGSSREEIKILMIHLKDLSGRSNICSRAYRILRHLQTQTGTETTSAGSAEGQETQFETLFDEWTDVREWMDSDMTNWNLDGAFKAFAP